MRYDYDGVTEIRHDRERRRVTIVSPGGETVLDGVERVYLKGPSLVEPDGTVRLNRGRVSVSDDGKEIAAGN